MQAQAGLVHEPLRALDVHFRQCDLLARLQANGLVIREGTGSHARPAHIHENRRRRVELPAHLFQAVDTRKLLVMVAVAEVESRNVHALLDEVFERDLAVDGRPHRADDFRALGLTQLHSTFCRSGLNLRALL